MEFFEGLSYNAVLLFAVSSVPLYSALFSVVNKTILPRYDIPASADVLLRLTVTLLTFITSAFTLGFFQFVKFWVIVSLVWFITTVMDRSSRPPGPFPLPIIGNTHLFAVGDIPATLMKISKQYGDIAEVWITGRRFVVLGSPKHMQKISNSKIYPYRSDVESRQLKEIHMLEKGLVLNHNIENWKMYKKWFMQGGALCMDEITKTCLEHTGPLTEVMESHTQAKGPVNLYGTLCAFLLDVSFKATFGGDLECLKKPDAPSTTNFMAFFGAIRYFTLTPSIVYNTITKKQTEHFRKIVKYFYDTEMDAIKRSSVEGAQTSEFLKYINEQREGMDVPDDEIQAVLHEALLGAMDSAAIVCNICHYLMKNPEVLRKMRDEMKRVNPTSTNWTEENLEDLVYCKQVIYETLRLSTTSPITGRMNSEDDVIDNYVIPEKTNIFLNFEYIHRNEQYWNDAQTFNPERFDEESPEKVSNMCAKYLFNPFGCGGRVCAGKKIGIIFIKSALVAMLPHFNIAFQEKELNRVWELVRVPVNDADWVKVTPLNKPNTTGA